MTDITDKEESSDFVFVYGTLMRGERAHFFLKGSHFVGVGVTPPAFTMVESTFPALIRIENGFPVAGEVYSVPPSTLENLDRYEGYPDFYTRKKYEVTLSVGHKVEAWVYVDATSSLMGRRSVLPINGVLKWKSRVTLQ